MKSIFSSGICILICTASLPLLAQEGPSVFMSQKAGGGEVAISVRGGFARAQGAVVQGAPYSATIKNEMVQTLADGNRIVQSSTGTIARDSLGRTRQDTSLPPIGNLAAANAPHLVFIQDPVAQASYTLNLTDKTAEKMPVPPMPPMTPSGAQAGAVPDALFVQKMDVAGPAGPGALPAPPMISQQVFLSKDVSKDEAQVTTEDLGSQTMEGLYVTGVRTTRTIAAGQIGNEKPISIVTEVWTSPDLKTVVYSKRSDPRMGEQTFQLTDITRSEPDPSLFAVPSDFKVVDGPKPIIYRSNQ